MLERFRSKKYGDNHPRKGPDQKGIGVPQPPLSYPGNQGRGAVDRDSRPEGALLSQGPSPEIQPVSISDTEMEFSGADLTIDEKVRRIRDANPNPTVEKQHTVLVGPVLKKENKPRVRFIQDMGVLIPGEESAMDNYEPAKGQLDSASNANLVYEGFLQELRLKFLRLDLNHRPLEGLGHQPVFPLGYVALYWLDLAELRKSVAAGSTDPASSKLTHFQVLQDPPNGRRRPWDFLLSADYLHEEIERQLQPSGTNSGTFSLVLRARRVPVN